MGFIRSFLLTLIVISFFVFLVGMNLFLTISYSLEYDKLKPSVLSLSENILFENEKIIYIENNIEKIRDYCRAHSEIFYNLEEESRFISCDNVLEGRDSLREYLLDNSSIIEENLEKDLEENYQNYLDYCSSNKEYFISNIEESSLKERVRVSCDIIENSVDEIILDAVSNYFDKVYYNKYNCDFSAKNLFFDCFLSYKHPFFLVSEQAKNYWREKFFSLLIINLILAGVIFLLVYKKSNWFFVMGISLILSSFPFMSNKWLSFFLDNKYLELYSTFFTQYYQIFLTSFLLGLFLIGIGFIFKIFKLGFYISKKINSFNEKIIKKSQEQKNNEKP